MKNILNATLSASGSPSEVKARITDQLRASAPEQADSLVAARTFIEKAIEGVSEDDTLSVNANISISVTDAPAVIVEKRKAVDEAFAAQLRTVKAEGEAALAAVNDQLAEARAKIEALTPKAPTVEGIANPPITSTPAQG